MIGELVERPGVSARLLRYSEEQRLLAPRRSAHGDRIFADSHIVVAQQIRGLIEAGFGTEVIAELLPCARGTAPQIDLCPFGAGVADRRLLTPDSRPPAGAPAEACRWPRLRSQT